MPRKTRQDSYSDSVWEPFYYETKPFLLLMLAFMGLAHAPMDIPFVKLNVLVLFGLSAYMIYSRATYRGYFK